MANKIIKEDTLVAIADSIRGKLGSEDKISPNDMPGLIDDLEIAQPVEPIVLTANCDYACKGIIAGNYIDMHGDTITTENITSSSSLFANNTVKYIPFELNFDATKEVSLSNMFYYCENLIEIPKINNCKPNSIQGLFGGCRNLRYLPNDINEWFNWDGIDNSKNTYSGAASSMFSGCYSLRSVPADFLGHENIRYTSTSGSILNCGFQDCYVLDSVENIPLKHNKTTPARTSNCCTNVISNCYRLKEFTFALNNGSPVEVNWKNQTIDASKCGIASIPYGDTEIKSMCGYNSGITKDKRVEDDATYQALKNNPDWFSSKIEYSRYNHDSAVNTINSLPDASAYLATAGGTNTIKFLGAAGSLTDGGAVNTLTAEEIAVATAKGWTITLI